MPRGGGFGGRGGGGFGRGGGGGFGMRRMGGPLIYPMGGWGMGGSPLLSTLMAGGLGYMAGSNSVQQAAPPAPVYQPPYPYQGPPAAPDANANKLAQLQLLGKLHDTAVLTDDEFEREKQQLLNS